MRFSVIVPVYNVEAYLEQCINSVLCQNFTDFELILVDDASPDGCPQICDRYAQRDGRVKVIHKENGGLSSARNAGIRLATGEFLLFLDSDDYWNCPDVLGKIQEVLDRYQADLVHFGRVNYFVRQDKLAVVPQRNFSKHNGQSPEDTIRWLVTSGNLTISACVMAVSRSLIVDNALYFKEGIKTEDLEWAIRVYLCKPRWAFLDDYFYIYRYAREGSITSNIDYKHLCDYCWILEQSVCRVEDAQEQMKHPLMGYLMYHALIASALTYRVQLTKEQKQDLQERLKFICRNRILRYTMNNKVRLAGYVYRFAGFHIMTKVLGFYLNKRNR